MNLYIVVIVIGILVAVPVVYLLLLSGGLVILQLLKLGQAAKWWDDVVGRPLRVVTNPFHRLAKQIREQRTLTEFENRFGWHPVKFDLDEQRQVDTRLGTLAREAKAAFEREEMHRTARTSYDAKEAKERFWRAHRAADALYRFRLCPKISDYYDVF